MTPYFFALDGFFVAVILASQIEGLFTRHMILVSYDTFQLRTTPNRIDPIMCWKVLYLQCWKVLYDTKTIGRVITP
jgi:hypothetical protein